MSPKVRSAKGVVFIAIMGALGNVLSLLSITVMPLVPSIPLGPISISIALDMSHLATFIAALFGGPVVGGLTGMIGGLIAAFQFGFSKGNFVTGFGLPIGKAMTGVAAGLIMNAFGLVNRRRLLMVPVTVVAYLPEAVYTALLFIAVLPPFFGLSVWLASLIAAQIVAKAFVEMVIMGLILAALLKNQGFTNYAKGFFG